MARYRHIFGPVPSRRFGRSLGIDLVPPKTCSFNCIFCEVGETDRLTLERKEYVPVDEITAELSDWFDEGVEADFVTLAGSGEPTLNIGFGKVLDFITENSGFRKALLTNGSLLHLPEVRADAIKADVVKVSLSGSDRAMLEKINRLHPAIDFEKMTDGIRDFRSEFRGRLWLEVVLVAGVNDSDDAVAKIAKMVRGFGPDKIHLNTVVRPPADGLAGAVKPERLRYFAGFFTPEAEVIVPFNQGPAKSGGITRRAVVDMLKRRPCSVRDIGDVFGVSEETVKELLDQMVQEREVTAERTDGGIYFRSGKKDVTAGGRSFKGGRGNGFSS